MSGNKRNRGKHLDQYNPRYENQLRTFLRILDEYPRDGQLSRFLPVFFRANRQMGSKDRKTAAGLIYNYFRIGNAAAASRPEERLFIAEFLCNNTSQPFLDYFKPELDQDISRSASEKIRILQKAGYNFNPADVFPFHKHLSAEIDRDAFLESFFTQPDLFIRIHPGKEGIVKTRLEREGVSFTEHHKYSLVLPAGTKLDQLFPEQNDFDGYFEVQDLSSQETGNYFQPEKGDYWWDCCAASGGKSLLLYHLQNQVRLLVSDLRENILDNLDKRFRSSGLTKYQKKILDLTKDPQPFLHDYEFDGIILDAPCSGSGTWGRTPELISQFRESKIEAFQRLQRSIASNVVKYLKPGKPLVYITCSAFRQENEDNIQFFTENLNLRLEHQQVIKGYLQKADTMFVARLIKGE